MRNGSYLTPRARERRRRRLRYIVLFLLLILVGLSGWLISVTLDAMGLI